MRFRQTNAAEPWRMAMWPHVSNVRGTIESGTSKTCRRIASFQQPRNLNNR